VLKLYKLNAVSTTEQSEAWRLLFQTPVRCGNTNLCCVSPQGSFLFEVVVVLMQLTISVSNNFSGEVHHIDHIVLLCESKIGHITRYVEDASC